MYETLEIKKRETKDKINLNQLRRSGQIPGIIYGKNMDSLPVQVSEKEIKKIITKQVHIFEVVLSKSETLLVNLENIQKHIISGKILHVSFQQVIKGQKTVVTLPLSFFGEAAGSLEGGVVTHQINEMNVEALPKDIPNQIEIDLSSLQINGSFSLKDVSLPPGVSFQETQDLEITLATCSAPQKIKEDEPVKDEVPEVDTVEEVKPVE